MTHLIDKDALVAEVERRYKLVDKYETNEFCAVASRDELVHLMNFINTLEVKELAPIAYVVTRCEEHSDYVEEVFFNEDKAREYCDQFKGNENEYARHITEVKVTL